MWVVGGASKFIIFLHIIAFLLICSSHIEPILGVLKFEIYQSGLDLCIYGL